jgi:hypothetical protein
MGSEVSPDSVDLVAQFAGTKSCAIANYRFPSIYNISGFAGCSARYYSDLCQRDPESESSLFAREVDLVLDWVCVFLRQNSSRNSLENFFLLAF